MLILIILPIVLKFNLEISQKRIKAEYFILTYLHDVVDLLCITPGPKG